MKQELAVRDRTKSVFVKRNHTVSVIRENVVIRSLTVSVIREKAFTSLTAFLMRGVWCSFHELTFSERKTLPTPIKALNWPSLLSISYSFGFKLVFNPLALLS
jgi:hypothetical protein